MFLLPAPSVTEMRKPEHRLSSGSASHSATGGGRPLKPTALNNYTSAPAKAHA